MSIQIQVMTKKYWVRNEVEFRSKRFGIDFANYLCSGIEFDWFMVESPSLSNCTHQHKSIGVTKYVIFILPHSESFPWNHEL